MTLPSSLSARSRLIAVATCLALASGATVGLTRQSKDSPLFATAPALVADIEDTVIAAGSLEASRMVSVGAQVSGQIRSLHVQLGDEVKAGDLIAENRLHDARK